MKTKWIITLVIVSALVGVSQVKPSSAQPASQDPNRPKLVDCTAEFIIGGLVLVVGVVIYVGLKKFCEKHLPPDQPPAPPPPPCTNCNPAHPSWPCTNCPPPAKSLVKSFAPFPLLQLDSGSAVDYSDITSYGWFDAFSNRFQIYFTTKIEESTNLIDWTSRFSLEGYVSFGDLALRWPSNAVTVVRSNGVAVGTNWSWLQTEPVSIDSQPAARKFYRLAHE